MFKLPKKIIKSQELENIINYPNNSNIAIFGLPGTGKTLAAIYRYKKIEKEGKIVDFLVFNKLLKIYLMPIISNVKTFDAFYGFLQKELQKKEFKYIKNESIEDFRNNCIEYANRNGKKDYLIIDEGQDISFDTLKSLSLIYDNISIFLDENQSISDIGESNTKINLSILEEYDYSIKELTKNYRTPEKIFNGAIKQFLPESEILNSTQTYEKLNEGFLPEFININNSNDIRKEIVLILDNNLNSKIGILFPFEQDVNEYYKFFYEKGYNLSKYHNKIKGTDFVRGKNILISTFKSSKGLEFDIVIIILIKDNKISNDQLFVLATRSKNKLYFLREE